LIQKKNSIHIIYTSGHWESTEDRKIAKYILENGKKWSEIAKMLENHRTEHMVKNRFKTMTIKLRKNYKDANSERDMLLKFMEDEEVND
jgi:heterodisulfide reductase subunit C